MFEKRRNIRLDIEIRTYTEMCDEREKYIKLLKEIEAHETERANDNQNRRMGIFEKIRSYKADSIDKFASEYGTLITVDNIVKMMKNRKVEKKKDDVQAFSSYLSSVIEEKVQTADLCLPRQLRLKEKDNAYVRDWRQIPSVQE